MGAHPSKFKNISELEKKINKAQRVIKKEAKKTTKKA